MICGHLYVDASTGICTNCGALTVTQITKPIMDDMIATRASQFEATLKVTHTRGRAKMVDAFRAGMHQMLHDLVNMQVLDYQTLPEKKPEKKTGS